MKCSLVMKLFCISFFILFIPLVFGTYADLDIYVTDSGIVTIEGLSDHSLIKPGVYDNLTSKDKGYWLLNITSSDVFNKYVFDLHLPKNSVVNFVRVYDINSFEDKDGLRIKGIVENKPFTIIVQYKINTSLNTSVFSLNRFLLMSGLVVLSILLLFGFYFVFIKNKIIPKQNYDQNMFSQREYEIIMQLQKNGGHMSQVNLQKLIDIPKASLSRNIASLERKEIIVKYKNGMSNMIKLK